MSPIKIYKVEPEKSGRSTLVLSFYNAGYASGVKDFHLRMRVVTRRPFHILVQLLYDSDDVMTRDAVIVRIGHEWLEAHVGTVDGVVRPGRDAHQAEIDDYLERADRALNAW
ncbi:hypothetical protein [Pseudonocardia endophytica]|uniref:hypothetical protein n=1 Tax=Pseudonocardia endophytica TaxID=401976 RepID=UPI0010430264|nr:hypothetical protein [Pseudonocardia endophytica]